MQVTQGWADLQCQGMAADYCWQRAGEERVVCQLSVASTDELPPPVLYTSDYEVMAADFELGGDDVHVLKACRERELTSSGWVWVEHGGSCLQCSSPQHPLLPLSSPAGGSGVFVPLSASPATTKDTQCTWAACDPQQRSQWFMPRGSSLEAAQHAAKCIVWNAPHVVLKDCGEVAGALAPRVAYPPGVKTPLPTTQNSPKTIPSSTTHRTEAPKPSPAKPFAIPRGVVTLHSTTPAVEPSELASAPSAEIRTGNPAGAM